MIRSASLATEQYKQQIGVETMPPTDSPSGSSSGPYRRGKALQKVVPLAKRLRDIASPGPRLRQYDPVSNLVTEEHPVRAAAFPVIEIHAHLGRWLTPDGSWMAPDVDDLLSTMEDLNLWMVVNLDGRWGDELEANLDRYDRAHPGPLCHLLPARPGCARRAWGAGRPRQIPRALTGRRRQGPQDLEEPRALGHGEWQDASCRTTPCSLRCGRRPERSACRSSSTLQIRSPSSSPWTGTTSASRSCSHIPRSRSQVTDSPFATGYSPRSRPWSPGIPVRSSSGPMSAASRRTCPGCRGCSTNTRISGSTPPLGPISAASLVRHPAWCERHQDRVLFGADVFPIDPEVYRLYFRLLETEDEHFRYTAGPGPSTEQGRWSVYGLGLAPNSARKGL